MKTYNYIALFTTEKDGGYSIYFPDVDGCYTCADTVEEGVRNAQEALELHLYGLQEENIDLPVPSKTPPQKMKNDTFAMMITVTPELTKDKLDNVREKTTVTIPRWLKKEAERSNINISRLLEATLKKAVAI